MDSALEVSKPFNLKRRFALTTLAVITADLVLGTQPGPGAGAIRLERHLRGPQRCRK